MINGVGNYEDAEDVSEAFQKTTPEDCFQIFGHRNLKQAPFTTDSRVFNLEGQAEYGGHLRCLKVTPDGIYKAEIKNNVYKSTEESTAQKNLAESPVADVLISLRHNKYVSERKYGPVSSFNFTDEAFAGKAWNSQTVKARGLYLDTAKGKVAARSYDKFFHIGEREETRLDALQRRFRFPLEVYVKENGFLGIVSYDGYEDGLFIACKSTTDSRFAGYLKEMVGAKTTQGQREALKAYLKENAVSFVFECVDMENDPHIIEYPESRLVLLDIVYNTLETRKYSYGELCTAAGRFGLTPKEKACEIADWQGFFDWYREAGKEGYLYKGRQVEGFVVEDQSGLMVKVKLAYYNFWKQMRAVSHEVMKKGFISNTAMLVTPTANEFYGWLRRQYEAGELKKMPKDICSLRRRFFEGQK